MILASFTGPTQLSTRKGRELAGRAIRNRTKWRNQEPKMGESLIWEIREKMTNEKVGFSECFSVISIQVKHCNKLEGRHLYSI